MVVSEIKSKGEGIVICSVYSGGWEILKRINSCIGERWEENIIIIEGDFNIRTGGLGGIEVEEGGKERSKDKIKSNKGRNFKRDTRERVY